MIGLVDGNNFFVSCERSMNPSLEGRPVAVLSNNDGCCVSRSNEFKALGIAMGTPYFQLKDREKSGEISFLSSNYELYGDMSRRIVSILRDEALDVEQYSIDEAFVVPPNLPVSPGGSAAESLFDYGRRLRAKILKWTGIPCGVGFAATKTLAKIANHIGKKRPEGVFVMPDDPTDVLKETPVGEVWGIGRRLGKQLLAMNVWTADEFRRLPDDLIRSRFSVTVLRTALELRGVACVDERDYEARPDSVSCSRGFGDYVRDRTSLAEAIANYTATAAEKLRRNELVAEGCNVYAEMGSACDSRIVGATVVFTRPTDQTNVMLAAVRAEAESLFVEGAKYRKAGVVFFGLSPKGSAMQADLFAEAEAEPSEPKARLYQVVDALNGRYGKGKVFSAAEGVARAWKMKRANLSPRATTRWDELLTVK